MAQIVVINPNLSAGFTEKIRRQVTKIGLAENRIIAVNPVFGPASIEGYYDEAFASVGLLSVIRDFENATLPDGTKAPATDGYVVACFDDTGVDAARCLTDAPVIGICEAALRMAAVIAARFAIVTPMPVSVRPLEHLVTRYGFASSCSVRAAGVRTLDFEGENSEVAYEALRLQAEISLDRDGAEAIVLGCAGMTDIALRLQNDLAVPVVDGVASGLKMIEALAAMGMRTSKKGAYSAPPAKEFSGIFAPFSPSNPG